MKRRPRIHYSAALRSEIWDRWQAGEPMSSIGRRLDRKRGAEALEIVCAESWEHR